MRVVGGREIHPINVRVGGFYRCPRADELLALGRGAEVGAGRRARDRALGRPASTSPTSSATTSSWRCGIRDEYPMNEGRLVSSRGLDIPIADIRGPLPREHGAALERAALGAARARRVLRSGRWPATTSTSTACRPDAASRRARRASAPRAGTRSRASWCARVETLYACDEALRWSRRTAAGRASGVEAVPGPGLGHGCTEAPRGILYHRYRLDDRGVIADAKIVPPTSQNQKTHRGRPVAAACRATSTCPRTS